MIEAIEPSRIGRLISTRTPLTMRGYQRAYSWDDDELEDFTNDILVLYNARLIEQPREHFFGGIVTVSQYVPSTATGYMYEIIDGQQRLATFVMAFKLLSIGLQDLASQARKVSDCHTEQNAEARAELMESNYLEYNELVSSSMQPQPRLKLSKADHAFFEKILDGADPETSRDSHKLMKAAWKKIREKLIAPILNDDAVSVETKLKHLEILDSCMKNDCYVIFIVSNDRNEAHRLFTVLNDRGRTLSDGDLLRAITLELLEKHSEIQEQVADHWDDILAPAQSEIEKFLRSYYPSHVGERAPSRNLSDRFREHFFSYPVSPLTDKNDAASVEERVANIKVESDTYSRIAFGEWPYDDSGVALWNSARLSRLINVLKHTLCIPLLLSAYHSLAEEVFSDLVSLLERFVFRYITIVGAHATPLSKEYYKHAREIREDPDGYNLVALAADLRVLATKRASDTLFETNLNEVLDYSGSSHQRRVTKHFLTTLEDHCKWFDHGASGNPKPDRTRLFDLNQITIEHIYPQNASVTEDSLEELKNGIGNLTFWAPNDNRAAGNDPFLRKKDRYEKSNIMLTRELSDLPDWDNRSLLRRRSRLVKMATKIFTV